jgi:hypothetical protein
MLRLGLKSAVPVAFALALAFAGPTTTVAQVHDNPDARGLKDDASQRGLNDDNRDWNALTTGRIDLLKAALQLTPEQQKYWPSLESALRARSQNRQAVVQAANERVDQMKQAGLAATIQDRDPVEFLRRRAQRLSTRAADLNKLADAWQPLYQTLSTEQKRRVALLTVYTIRDMRNRVEDRRIQALDEEGED